MKQTIYILTLIVAFLIYSFCGQSVVANEVDSIKISAKSEGYLLDGLLLKKSNDQKKKPVVIFLGGSGNSSHRTNYKDFVQFFLEKTFLENGFAVAYFDKRGLGKSQGTWYETTFEQRALDAKNVALEIQKSAFIDVNKVFLIGHSQGGWIVQIALSQFPEVFAGGVSMAGATFGVKKQLINDYQSDFICEKGFDEREALDKATRKVDRDLFIVSLIGRKGNWKQLKLIKNFEPEPYLKRINKPLLFMLAENDELVNSTWAIDELKRLFPNNLPLAFEVYLAPGQSHSFKVAPKCYKGRLSDIYYSESTNQKLFSWISKQAGIN